MIINYSTLSQGRLYPLEAMKQTSPCVSVLSSYASELFFFNRGRGHYAIVSVPQSCYL
jgi:hypothetical protein